MHTAVSFFLDTPFVFVSSVISVHFLQVNSTHTHQWMDGGRTRRRKAEVDKVEKQAERDGHTEKENAFTLNNNKEQRAL